MIIFKYGFFISLFLMNFISAMRYKDNPFFTQEARRLIEKMYLLSFHTENKDLLFILADRFKKYIFNHIRPDIPKDRYNNLKELKAKFELDNLDNGTYDLYSRKLVQFERGYQCSFETIVELRDEEFRNHCYAVSMMTDEYYYLGVWDKSKEISFHFDDLELAYVSAIIFNQYSFYDWTNKKEIKNAFYAFNPIQNIKRWKK